MEELGRVASTLAKGARQLVVQLALETMLRSGVYLSSFTPMTNIGASLLGAVITTFLAPPCITPYTETPQNPRSKIYVIGC